MKLVEFGGKDAVPLLNLYRFDLWSQIAVYMEQTNTYLLRQISAQ